MSTDALELSLEVNGEPRRLQAAPATLLVDLIRDTLALTGTHVGCDTAQCGACTVLLDGRAVKACNMLALQADGARLQTIEGVAQVPQWQPMQRAFSQHHALQCGYCTPGMVMRGLGMASEGVPAEPDAVRAALSGNLCRCTGYEGIVGAICEGLRCLHPGGRDAAV